MKTVHGEAAYRNKKHKGLNSAKHQNGYNKLCSSLITTTATVHQAPGDSNGAIGRMNHQYSNGLSNGLSIVKSEFNGSSGHDQQLSPSTGHHQQSVQMDTTGLTIGRGLVPNLNSVNSYLNGDATPERHLANSGQFASGLSNHHPSSKLEHSNLIANSSYSQPVSSSHLTTKNEPTSFNDLNNFNYYNSTYGGQLLDNHHNAQAKDDRLADKHHANHQNQHQHLPNQSTNWTPGQLTNSFNEHQNFNHQESMIGNPFDRVQPDTGLMPPPASNQPSTMHSSYHPTTTTTTGQLGKTRDLEQCLQTDDEGIGSESCTNCTEEEEDDEPSQRIMNGMQHYSAPNGDGSLLVMTQHHQPLSRANIKGSRPSLKNRLKTGIKSWIPTIFHKSSNANSNACPQYEQQTYPPVDQQPASELATLNCSSNYQQSVNCNSRQSGKKKTKEGGLKVPFLTKSRKNKSYEEQVAKEECVKETTVPAAQPTAANPQSALEECDQLDQIDLPDEVMQYLKEKDKSEGQSERQSAADPRSPMIVSQLSPSTANPQTDPKMAQLNSLAIQQPFSPMSVNSPNTPAAINNPLSPMQTDSLNSNLNSNNLNDSTVNKPPPSYTFATQQLNQQQQRQQSQLNQVDRCNNSFANETSSNSYLNQSSYSSSYNQSNYNNYNQQINHSSTSNYYGPNYASAPSDPYSSSMKQTAQTINNGCVGGTSKIERYVNNQNINIYVNSGGQNAGGNSSAGMMSPFYNYAPSNCNSYANWHQPSGHQQPMYSVQSQSRQSAMSIDTNNNSSYAYQSNSLMPPPITYTQQLSSQLTPPVPSSLLMNQPAGHSEMCRPMSAMNGRCDSRCDSRNRLMSPMQICSEPMGNMVINDMTSGLTSLAEENLLLKMRLN